MQTRPAGGASAPVNARLLIDEPASGAWNMAVEEALLESAAAGSFTLRLYRWARPTLSLGYFQRYADRHLHAASLECDCVRRCTGGGAILHDRELTYSLTVPPNHAMARFAPALYEAVHEALIEALRQVGMGGAQIVRDPEAETDGQFLCFQRRAANDVVVGQFKIVGSAQRRSRGAVLQHGSILLGTSPAAPELPGLEDVADRSWNFDDFLARWLERMTETLNIQFVEGALTADEAQRAAEIEAEKYGTSAWTQKR